MDQSELILILIYTVKTYDKKLFHYCNGEMAVFGLYNSSYDGHNYSCYLTQFEALVTNFELTHPSSMDIIVKGDSLRVLDKKMKEIFMKFTQGSGVLLGNLEQHGAYQCWCQTTSDRACYYEEALEIFVLLDDPDVPKERRHQKLHQSHIKKSEAAVLKVVSAIQSFINPWRVPDKNGLYSQASGSPVNIIIENGILGTEDLGTLLTDEFIN